MARIEVAKIDRPTVKHSTANMLAQLCYYYPQYTLQEARKLPYKHVRLLLDEMRRIKADDFLNLLQISVAPHTEKGKAVKELANFYKGLINE